MNTPWFQLVFSLIAMIMIANLQYAWTLFVEPMRDARAWQLSQIQGAFAFFILLQTWVQPLDGWFIDKIGPRRFITVAGILCGVGWSLMGYATTLPQLYFLYGTAGIGAAFVYSGCVGSALKWFPNRRGFASGIIAAGFGGGTFLFVPVIAYLIRDYSYQAAFLATGIFQGIVITVVAQFLRHPGPAFVAPAAASTASAAKFRRNTENFTTAEMLRTPHFYILYFMFAAMATGGLFVTANSGSLVRSWGMTVAVLTTATALSPLANGASRIFWGWCSDRTGRENAMVVAFFLQALALVSVVTLGRTSGLMFTITLILTYFTWGEIYSLFPSTLGDYFGGKHATSNYGFLYTAKGVAAIIGGYLGAILFEQFGSWTAVFYGSAVLALLSGVTAIVLRTTPLPKKAAGGKLVASGSVVR